MDTRHVHNMILMLCKLDFRFDVCIIHIKISQVPDKPYYVDWLTGQKVTLPLCRVRRPPWRSWGIVLKGSIWAQSRPWLDDFGSFVALFWWNQVIHNYLFPFQLLQQVWNPTLSWTWIWWQDLRSEYLQPIGWWISTGWLCVFLSPFWNQPWHIISQPNVASGVLTLLKIRWLTRSRIQGFDGIRGSEDDLFPVIGRIDLGGRRQPRISSAFGIARNDYLTVNSRDSQCLILVTGVMMLKFKYYY